MGPLASTTRRVPLTDASAAIVNSASAIVYDVSRLIRRRASLRPTGIDRIDLEFLRTLSAQSGDRLKLVTLSGNRPVFLSQTEGRYLIQRLSRVWLEDDGAPVSIPRLFEYRGLATARSSVGLSQSQEQGTIHSVMKLAALVRRTCFPGYQGARVKGIDGGFAYVNVGHHGLPRSPKSLEILANLGMTKIFAYLHDLIPISHPEFLPSGSARRFLDFLEALCSCPNVEFLVNSSATMGELREWMHARNLDNSVSIVPPSLNHVGRHVRSHCLLPNRAAFFLTVGSIEPRKNHALLLAIWRRLAQRFGPRTPKLIIAGHFGWNSGDILHQIKTGSVAESFAGNCVSDWMTRRSSS